MRIFTLLAFVCFGINNYVAAQPEEGAFDDLMLLYMDEKFDKLLAKSEKMAEDDKFRKDPTPYLYASKALFEMSKREEYAKDYPTEKALRMALRWASKYRRKDPDGTLYKENEVYFEELKDVVVEEATNNMMEENYSKAKRYYDSICDFDPEDPGAWMMLGYCNLKLRSMEAKDQLAKGGKLATERDPSGFLPVEKQLLSFALITYGTHLKNEGMRDSAATVMRYGDPALMEDKEFKLVYSEIVR